mgnify:CR=1 FL=1
MPGHIFAAFTILVISVFLGFNLDIAITDNSTTLSSPSCYYLWENLVTLSIIDFVTISLLLFYIGKKINSHCASAIIVITIILQTFSNLWMTIPFVDVNFASTNSITGLVNNYTHCEPMINHQSLNWIVGLQLAGYYIGVILGIFSVIVKHCVKCCRRTNSKFYYGGHNQRTTTTALV